MTIFNSTEGLASGIGRLKDWSVSGQADRPIGKLFGGPSLVFSFAGKLERMLATPAMMPDMMMLDMMMTDSMPMAMAGADSAGTVMYLDEDSTIAVAQLKLTIPVKDAGVKIPISITYANRTNLIEENEIRGSIGFSLDLDALFGS